MEFRLANGTVITDEDIERECAEYESGSWTGALANLRVGRPRLSEGEATACGMRKSEFLRSAALEKAERILRSA